MPLYDFACEECGAEYEASAEAGGTAPCAACGSQRTRRLWRPIAPPLKFGLRGRAARESNARRADRENTKKEQFIAERRRKRGEAP